MFDFFYSHLTIFSILAVILQFVHLWFYSEGKLKIAYPLAVVVYSVYFVVETTLGFATPEQMGILIFNIVNIWGVMMAVKGIKKVWFSAGESTLRVSNADVDKLISLAHENDISVENT